jgi:hypothetical protein
MQIFSFHEQNLELLQQVKQTIQLTTQLFYGDDLRQQRNKHIDAYILSPSEIVHYQMLNAKQND